MQIPKRQRVYRYGVEDAVSSFTVLVSQSCMHKFCLDLQRPVCPLLIFDINFDLYSISTGDVLDALLYDKAKMTFLDTNDQF